jgi:hypothetical protein
MKLYIIDTMSHLGREVSRFNQSAVWTTLEVVRPQKLRCRARHCLPSYGLHEMLNIASMLPLEYADGPQAAEFAPRMDSSIAFAAGLAAVPPIVYWTMVVMRERSRIDNKKKKDEEREELKKKIFDR